jgi:LDH2 family malate/lactate/ureidoglycolate dehydrogenase
MTARYPAPVLRAFASRLLQGAGLAADRADDVAAILVEGDLLGHTTHGLQLLGPYLQSLQDGTMTTAGQPEVVADRGAALTWDGNFLPGPWLVLRALGVAFARLPEHAVVSIAIRRSHHIGCLAAYLTRATDRGYAMLLLCSDPSVASVAPFGGTAGRYTPNPLAFGYPTGGPPALIDISASTTTNGLVARLNRAGRGERLPGAWLVGNRGNATDDPAAFAADPPGAICRSAGWTSATRGSGSASSSRRSPRRSPATAGQTASGAGVRRCSCNSSIRRRSAGARRSCARRGGSRRPAAPRR